MREATIGNPVAEITVGRIAFLGLMASFFLLSLFFWFGGPNAEFTKLQTGTLLVVPGAWIGFFNLAVERADKERSIDSYRDALPAMAAGLVILGVLILLSIPTVDNEPDSWVAGLLMFGYSFWAGVAAFYTLGKWE
ncbi:MAG: hypothetical protein ACXIUL_06620 [Wenzhouxiangella sp.]